MTGRVVQFKSKAESHRALHSIASCCFFFFLVSDTLLLSSNVCYGIAHTHGRKKKKKKKTRQDIRERENTHTHIRRQPCLNSCITSFFFFYSSFHSVTHTNRGRERERETKKSEEPEQRYSLNQREKKQTNKKRDCWNQKTEIKVTAAVRLSFFFFLFWW